MLNKVLKVTILSDENVSTLLSTEIQLTHPRAMNLQVHSSTYFLLDFFYPKTLSSLYFVAFDLTSRVHKDYKS